MSKENWQLFETAVKHLNRVFLVGPPGVGKTFAAQHAVRENNQKVISITLSEDVVLQELLGHFIPRGGEFVWHDGPLTTAIREGSLVVVNELGRASSSVKDAMLGVLDAPDVCQIVLPTGEVVRPVATFTIIATSNSGVDELDPALADRFECVIVVSVPHPALIQHMNSLVSGLGELVSRSYAEPAKAISPRAALTYAKLVDAKVPQDRAAAVAFGAKGRDILANLKLATKAAVAR
jgi:nitric oxide reductase NorQ protein